MSFVLLAHLIIILRLQLVLVSVKPWHGDAQDVSSTLKLLGNMRGGVGSPTYGKVLFEHVICAVPMHTEWNVCSCILSTLYIFDLPVSEDASRYSNMHTFFYPLT